VPHTPPVEARPLLSLGPIDLHLLPAQAAIWLAAAILSLALTALARRTARRHPRLARIPPGAGTERIALLGGAAVLAAMGAALWLAGLLSATRVEAAAGGASGLGSGTSGTFAPLAGLLLAFALLGLIDDLRPLPPAPRLLIECLAAGAALELAFGRSLNHAGELVHWMFVAVGSLGVAFFANAFNMADNADGLAAGTGCLAFLALAFGGSHAGLALAASGALAGFFIWNRPPARAYLGDHGSLPLGALLGLLLGLQLAGTVAEKGEGAGSAWGLLARAAALALIVGYPLLDPVHAVLGRLRRREAPWRGGCDHPSHRLALVFGSWKRALAVILLVQACSVLAGALVLRGLAPGTVVLPALALWALLLAAGSPRRGRVDRPGALC